MQRAASYTTTRYKHYSSYIFRTLPHRLLYNKYLPRIVTPLTIESSHIIYQTMNDLVIINPYVHSGIHVVTIGFLFRGISELYATSLPATEKESTIDDAIFITRFFIVIFGLYYGCKYLYNEYYQETTYIDEGDGEKYQ